MIIWGWVNTYRYITIVGYSHPYIPAIFRGEQKVPGFWPIPIYNVWMIYDDPIAGDSVKLQGHLENLPSGNVKIAIENGDL